MAGVPPLLGFVGKEAAFAAFLDGGLDRTAAAIELAVLVVGSALTVAYTLRFRWGAFARKPGLPDAAPPSSCTARAPLFLVPPALLALAGLRRRAGRPGARAAGRRRTPRPAAARAGGRELALWHGWQPALLLSAVSLLGGVALFAARRAGDRLQRRFAVGAGRRGLLERHPGGRPARLEVTGATQRGSLPAYLGTILVVVLACPARC